MSDNETSREDRQLPASERRLQQAREEGQVARSRELGHLAAVLSLLGLLAAMGPWLARQALEMVAGALSFGHAAAFDERMLVPRLGAITELGLWILVPVAVGIAVPLVGANVAVGGFNLSTKAAEMRMDRLDPMAGLGRLFDWRHLLSQLRMAVGACALLAAGGWYVANHADGIDALARVALPQAVAAGFDWISAGLGAIAAICFFSALADVPMAIWRHRADLRMTHDEARRENKESEGDPHLKGERRRRARSLARGRMLADVPKATVVVTNPTHYAVALQYDEATMAAPRIVAMGADHMALRIREIARAARVPTLEAPPLARALYAHGKPGGEVPVQLYTAVAQVLAWVWRLRNAIQPPPLPDIVVPAGLDPSGEAA